MEDPLCCDPFDLPGLFFAEAEALGAQDAGSSSSRTDTFRPGTMQVPEAMVEESTNDPALWFTGNQVTEPLAGAVTDSQEFEIGLEFSDEPSDGSLSGCWIGPTSIFSDSRTWSSLALVVFTYSVLMCLLWFSPKPQAQSFKFMEVQLVSMKGDANDAGLSLGGPREPGATDIQSGAEINAGEKINQETPPLESKSLPIEKRNDAPQNAPVKKHAKPVPVQHKEKQAVAQLQPAHTDSPSQSDTPTEGSGQVAGGAGAAVSSGAGLSGGSGVDGASNGSVERAFGAPDGPSFLHRVVPSYPVSAKRLEKQGTVLLRVTIDECGRPCQVEVLQKAGFGLDEEAVRAVKESTFVPAKRNGKPLTCKALLPIRFVLKQS
jgi:periplasmic protein TonB